MQRGITMAELFNYSTDDIIKKVRINKDGTANGNDLEKLASEARILIQWVGAMREEKGQK